MNLENGYVVLADGQRLKAISGGGGGAGGGGGMAGAQQAAGAGQNIDFTFGQKGVYDDKVKRESAMLDALIRASAGAGANVTGGQTPGPAQYQRWDPQSILNLTRMLMSFRG